MLVRLCLGLHLNPQYHCLNGCRTFRNFDCETTVSGVLYYHAIYLQVHTKFISVPSLDCDIAIGTQEIKM
jgi:hypothetical protein